MNCTRKMSSLLLGLAMAAFALPGIAGNDKKFSLVMSSPDSQSPPPYVLQAIVKNEGNSTISSFSLSVTGGLTVVGVTQPTSGNASFTGSTVTVKNMRPVKSGDSFTVTMGVDKCGDLGVWSAAVWTGSSLNGQSFAIVPGHSNLDSSISCGDPGPGDAINVPFIFACGVTGERGYYDRDGTVGSPIPYFVTVTNPDPAHEALHFRWPDDNTGDPRATFEYDVCAPDPIPDGTTQVAWLNQDGTPANTPGTPAFIDALECLQNADFLPEPYGKLVSDNGATLTVDTSQPAGAHPAIPTPATPFDIVIENERLTVNAIACVDTGDDDEGPDSGECNETGETPGPIAWYVTRGVGNTTPVTHTGTPLVMSTPLPLLPSEGVSFPYTAGSPALMCIAVPASEVDETGNHVTTFIDIGDSHVTGP